MSLEKQLLAKTRKAFEDKTLQMFLPLDKQPTKGPSEMLSGNGCRYLTIVDGVHYHCAVGAMFTEHDEEFAREPNLNNATDAYGLVLHLNLNDKLACEFINDCFTLQARHDAVVEMIREKMKPDYTEFLSQLEEMERTNYVRESDTVLQPKA